MPVRIKICGITNPADAEEAAALGADAIGLNFYAGSPRLIDEAMARQILGVLPPFVEPVGLFVNETSEHVHGVAQRLGLRTVQLHGHLEAFAPPAGLHWIPAFSVCDAASLPLIDATLKHMKRTTAPSALLVDAHVPGSFGGTGQVAPWPLLAGYHPGVPLILAGGLTPDNVAEAISIVHPYAVDVASGVESHPGKKDADRMRRFIKAVRALTT